MSNFLIQYTVEALNLSDATNVAYEILYGANIDAKDVRVFAANYASGVHTFDEASEEFVGPLDQANADFKRDHPWGT